MIYKILLCLFVILAFFSNHISAQDSIYVINIPASCGLIEKHEYEMTDYLTPRSKDIYSLTPQIIKEYGVLYNIDQMPFGYEIPTILKAFAVENEIDGVTIVPDDEAGSAGFIAEITRTIEKKIVLNVTDNVTQNPELIVKILMGITDTHEVQSRELRSAIIVNQEDKGWRANFAKTVQKGIKKITNVELGTKIDFNKINIEESGYFEVQFAEEKTNLTIRGHGPFEVKVKEITNVISSVKNITTFLVLKVVFKDESAPYADNLYFGDDGKLYNCRSVNN